MGIPDSSLLDLIDKVRSWLSWGASDPTSPPLCISGASVMPNSCVKMCSGCDLRFTDLIRGYLCQNCGIWSCVNCVKGYKSPLAVGSIESNNVKCNGESIKSCKFCKGVTLKREGGGRYSEKVHPSTESPRESPEPPSPSYSCESIQADNLACYLESRDCGYSPHAVTGRSLISLCPHPSMVSVRHSPIRSDEEADDSGKQFYSPSSEYCHDMSDIDSCSVSARLEFYSCKSFESSPLDSPSRTDFTSYRVGQHVRRELYGDPLSQNSGACEQETTAMSRRSPQGSQNPENSEEYPDDSSILPKQYDKSLKPLDFESNGLLWFPPLPEDENDEVESDFITYDDEDDDVGESGAVFASCSSLGATFASKEKPNEVNKEPIRAVIQGHFRALVSQLLVGEDIKINQEDDNNNWLDIVTTIAWQAANFVKPDTSRGGSMDPGDYMKVKCIASGLPMDSTLVKGIVCTKNIKHKRMTTQYKNPRLLLLGGALEYQNVMNPLASFNTLVQQENDHLKMIISKIEALRPNVLLVEKSASPYAQEYLLAKEISLVPNVKKPLLERIARCTGAQISPSMDNISTRLGHCELFRVEKISEDHEPANQFNKRPSKTLMFFEGCPRRLGCTVLLRGASREDLKKLKRVFQYAVFAAYHLSLETSFLADEGASLPDMTLKHSTTLTEKTSVDGLVSAIPPTDCQKGDDASAQNGDTIGLEPKIVGPESLGGDIDTHALHPSSPCVLDDDPGKAQTDDDQDDLATAAGRESFHFESCENLKFSALPSDIETGSPQDLPDGMDQEEKQLMESRESIKSERIYEDEVAGEYFPATDTYQSILVSFSSRCVLKGAVCERSRLHRIKFYGLFDKPLGRYLRDDLFDQTSYCRSCKETAEAHVLCYTHQQGNLTINVRSLPSIKLPGERDGKIWMWHRCLRCAYIDGVPPATRRVVMSDAAWGLSFGKFLELSFSNHVTAKRLAPCGHSLQRDCLRFYGFGNMVASFRYSPIEILSVHLPPSVLEFNGHGQEEWIRKEAAELLGQMEGFYMEISNVLDSMEQKSKSSAGEISDTNEIHNHIVDLQDQLRKERSDYNGVLELAVMEGSESGQAGMDILEINRMRRALLIGSHFWDRQLYSLDHLLRTNSSMKSLQRDASSTELTELRANLSSNELHISSKLEESVGSDLQSALNETSLCLEHSALEHSTLPSNGMREVDSVGESQANKALFDDISSHASNLSDRIDSVWTGTYQLNDFNMQTCDNLPLRRVMPPVRVNSFDSALRVQERIRKGLPPSSLYLSTLRSFHASGDYRNMVRDLASNAMRTYSQTLPLEGQKLNLIPSLTPSFVPSAAHMSGGARLLLPQRGHSDVVIGVYDDDYASIVSYALSSKEYEDWIANKSNDNERSCSTSDLSKDDSAASLAWQSFDPVNLDHGQYGSYGSEDHSSSVGSLFMDTKKSPHLTISYGDDSLSSGGKVKFTVTCYFAKQFDGLRKKCCPSDVDFIRSLSRCKRWSAQGGKSNVQFSKSVDERFIIKQVKKTELDSFEEFAPQYFKYLTDSLTSGSPTCLAKILGIFQVTVKYLKGGKELKMDLMVMENLFFERNISRVYDLKGSARSRYNKDTTGTNKVLLDTNLEETLRTDPIFLGSKAKRSLERAIWNDTSFLASIDVMDYSLLVGIDKERKELVLGIIDFMRQYTWDKHLETWVKASGLLGGPKNAAPTIVSPKQYKKRFRKAMTSYFLTVPDQWSS